MWLLLAQAEAAGGLATVAPMVLDAFSRPDALAHPHTVVLALREAPMLLMWILLVVGVVCVSHGLVLYREAVVAAALIAGTVIGYRLGRPVGGEIILALCVGVLTAGLAWPLMRYAVGAFTAAAGGVLVSHAASLAFMQFFDEPTTEALACGAAVVGVFVAGCLVLRLGEASAVLLMSIGGALLVTVGAVGVLLHLPGIDRMAGVWLMNQPLALPITVAAVTTAGLFMQRGLRDRLRTQQQSMQPEPVE